LRLARPPDELDLESIARVDLHDRADVSTLEPEIGQVSFQDRGFQELESHRLDLGYAVTNRGRTSRVLTIQ